jgi:glycine/D-amino acid oxidase-like deaminating enzyme/nitrite reductase/ring-hydroxylating ferredoxin subunit
MDMTSATTPIWWHGDHRHVPWYPALDDDTYADVCVVGLGLAGVTTAYLLAREGKTVVAIDDGGLAGGETGRTTAHITAVLDDRYYGLERLHGLVAAKLAAESHVAAIDRIEAIASAEDIACEFERVDGYLIGNAEILDRELAACHRAGLDVARTPLRGGALRFPRQAQFDPVRYVEGLARAILRDGGRIYGGTHAVEMHGGTTGRVVTDTGKTITAGAIVIATGAPVNDVVTLHTKQAAYRTYVIALPMTEPVEPALYWDTETPHHYARTRGDMLIVGGADHKTGQADDAESRYAALEQWARREFATTAPVARRWSGQILEPVDGLAFIGPNPGVIPNIYVATGDSGNGMTYGTIAGMLLTDLIMCRENPWAKLYDPARLTVKSGVEYAKANLNVAGQYARWITPGEVPTVAHIAKGVGAVIRRGITKIAAYRDERGKMHECSAVCPHLFCIVDWNSTEHTWDCPCHGSRFDPYGKVINGPAVSDLEPLNGSRA